MDAVELMQCAQAKGIDFVYVAGIASNTDGLARPRKLSLAERKSRNEQRLGMDVVATATGTQSRSSRRPTWTVSELGQAAGGLGPIPWAAALYSYAGARDGYWLLWRALATEAHRLAKREHWPARVRTEDGNWQFYTDEMAELILLADANSESFKIAPELHAIALKVTAEIWDKELKDPFRSLRNSYDRWLGIARGSIARWICEPSS